MTGIGSEARDQAKCARITLLKRCVHYIYTHDFVSTATESRDCGEDIVDCCEGIL